MKFFGIENTYEVVGAALEAKQKIQKDCDKIKSCDKCKFTPYSGNEGDLNCLNLALFMAGMAYQKKLKQDKDEADAIHKFIKAYESTNCLKPCPTDQTCLECYAQQYIGKSR